MNVDSSPTVREGVHRATRRPPSRSGYCPRLALGLLTLSVLVTLSCTGTRRSGIPAGAQTALDAAIADIDAGQYDKLYEEASDEWKRQSVDQSKSNLQTLRDKLGRARTRDLQTAREEQTSTGPVPGHSVTVIYQTSFDRGEGIETFTLIEHSGRWALAKYYVSSSGLK
jgi:hypothetical protein